MASSSLTMLISVDGMSSAGLAAADTPTIDGLRARGASTLMARTVMPSVTLPCHTSMLRGVDVPRHGITTNTFAPLARPVPSLMDVAARSGLRVGAFYNWPELRDLAEPGSVHVSYARSACETAEHDWAVAYAVSEHLAAEPFDLLFTYFGATDSAGHEHGWMTPGYIAMIHNVDRCIAHVLDAARRMGRDVTVLVTSDHGGHGRTHGTDCDDDMRIPWVLAGPRVQQGLELLTPVRGFDTCPTLAHCLNIAAAPQWDGRIIEEAFIPVASAS
ncbi:MAG: alkaline phosphatase family protein [Armatimonadetes bacterium]|nr:alkaline phosphatase family protein [Armatimonadota bacterium]MDE2206215.1 alkaline phosphatase family protein [Armatimonadota bacterium]